MDQSALFGRFKLEQPMSDQAPLALQRPAVFACPSDGIAMGGASLRSYGGNVGWWVSNSPGFPRGSASPNGVFAFLTEPVIGPRDVIDGMSNTAQVSEMLPSGGSTVRQIVWNEKSTGPLFARPVDQIASDCLSATATYNATLGGSWTFGGVSATLYDHVLPPGSRNCNWVHPSGSAHVAGGVTTAFCDGSTKYIAAPIDAKVWRAMGTRNGGEAFSFP